MREKKHMAQNKTNAHDKHNSEHKIVVEFNFDKSQISISNSGRECLKNSRIYEVISNCIGQK